jgi:hypothetical protein
MSDTRFDITTTSTLQAVATSDEQALVSDLEQRVAEALEHAGQQAEVADAAGAHQAAEATVKKLQTAARVLNETAKDLRQQVAAAQARAVDKLVDSAAENGKPDYAQSTQLATLEYRERLTARALERLVEQLTPVAQMARLRTESHSLLARARAIEQAAQLRAERILDQIRDAVSDEIVLPVDLSKGVAGALLTHAVGLKGLAVQASTNADQLEKWYMDRNRKD